VRFADPLPKGGGLIFEKINYLVDEAHQLHEQISYAHRNIRRKNKEKRNADDKSNNQPGRYGH
jgi:hypothetical protein